MSTEPDIPSPLPLESRLHQSLVDYWLDRARIHFQDSYAGIPMTKFPEDLVTYEHLMWDLAPDTIIEIGTWCGASALWFRDRLRTLERYGKIGAPRVISIDSENSAAHTFLQERDAHFAESITLVRADVLDPDLPGRISELLSPGARCLVVDDSAHTYDTTMAALRGFSGFVAIGSYFVVEDGCVDVEDLRMDPEWPRGVLPAIRDWLLSEAGARFHMRRDLERYIVTCHPRGFLQRQS